MGFILIIETNCQGNDKKMTAPLLQTNLFSRTFHLHLRAIPERFQSNDLNADVPNFFDKPNVAC